MITEKDKREINEENKKIELAIALNNLKKSLKKQNEILTKIIESNEK